MCVKMVEVYGLRLTERLGGLRCLFESSGLRLRQVTWVKMLKYLYLRLREVT